MVDRFVSRRRADWERLESLIRLGGGRRVGALSAQEIVELGYLYRRAAADLAVARRDYPGDRVALYLNQLVGRAHAVVYRSEAGEWRKVTSFYRRGFPALVRETLPFTGIAFLLFSLAAMFGFLAILLFPDDFAYLIPDNVASAVAEKRMWTDDSPVPPQIMSSLIMTNNIRVALLAFAGGVLFGAPTFFVLAYNGLLIGAVAGVCQANGLSLGLWSFVAPHGFIELTVIFIVGGSGLHLGYALLRPGLHTRLESLRVAAHKVVRLIFGCLPLLVVAGIVEGFVSPSSLPPLAKIAIGVCIAVLLYSYLFLAGRQRTNS